MNCRVCGTAKRVSLVEEYCPECDATWYCYALPGDRKTTEDLFHSGPQIVYGTRDELVARAAAWAGGHVYRVKRAFVAEVGVEPVYDLESGEELEEWFSICATFAGWSKPSRERFARDSSTPAQDPSSA